jgi:hypothetical protein
MIFYPVSAAKKPAPKLRHHSQSSFGAKNKLALPATTTQLPSTMVHSPLPLTKFSAVSSSTKAVK